MHPNWLKRKNWEDYWKDPEGSPADRRGPGNQAVRNEAALRVELHVPPPVLLADTWPSRLSQGPAALCWTCPRPLAPFPAPCS